MLRTWGVAVLAWLLVGPVPLQAGNESGNGGDVVYCETTRATATLLDFFEASVLTPQLAYDLGEADLAPIEKARIAVRRLERVDPKRAARYLAQVESFESNVRWVRGVELPDIPDSGYVPIDPVHCKIKQIAIRKPPLSPEHRLYTINEDLHDLFDNDNRAGLMLHEIVYGELYDRGQKNSIKARYFTALISSDYLDTLSQADYDARLAIVLEEAPLPGDSVAFSSDTFEYAVKADECFELDLSTLLKSVGTGNLSWSIISLPKYATLNAGILRACPRRTDVGQWTMQLVVKQGDQGALARLTLQVVAENVPPLWTQNPIVLEPGCVGKPMLVDLSAYAQDIDGDALSFRKTSGPAWIAMSPDGRLMGTPSLADVGSFRMSVVATDGQGQSAAAEVVGQIKETCY
ncbi:MAG: hypothetical protein KDD51_07615 [Bdellovibrionales bacterium]|nr:hypothetical protein [Bdellovibrionales bacterium]